jgi:uncharacterized membrane protein YdjX (TVP38/TMEM64 family)
MHGSTTKVDQLERSASPWKRAAAIVLLCGVLVFVASSDILHQALLRAVEVTRVVIDRYPTLGMSAFVALAAISAVLAFFSSAVLVPVAVEAWGKALSVLLLWSGWTLGGICAYGLGRSLGRRIVLHIVSGDALARFEERITVRAPFSLVLLFQVALPSEVPGHVLGLLRYSFVKYVAALGIAELPYAVATIYLGESVLERRASALLAIGLTLAVLSAWALRTLQKRLSD